MWFSKKKKKSSALSICHGSQTVTCSQDDSVLKKLKMIGKEGEEVSGKVESMEIVTTHNSQAGQQTLEKHPLI